MAQQLLAEEEQAAAAAASKKQRQKSKKQQQKARRQALRPAQACADEADQGDAAQLASSCSPASEHTLDAPILCCPYSDTEMHHASAHESDSSSSGQTGSAGVHSGVATLHCLQSLGAAVHSTQIDEPAPAVEAGAAGEMQPHTPQTPVSQLLSCPITKVRGSH